MQPVPTPEILFPSPKSFGQAVGGRSITVTVGALRRAKLQEQRLRAVHVAARHLGHGGLAEASLTLLAAEDGSCAEWFNSPSLGAWIEATLLAIDSNAPPQHVSAIASSLGCPSGSVAGQLASMTSELVQSIRLEAGGEGAIPDHSRVDTKSLAAVVDLPGIEWRDRLTGPTLVEARSRALQAQSLIARHLPWLNDDRTTYITRIVPVMQERSRLLSWTNSRLLGAVFVTDNPDPGLVAEQIVHEGSHTRLFLMQELDDLLMERTPNESWTDARYYSPWRRDPRPLNGILHGAFVFDAVAEFWSGMLNDEAGSVASRDHARRRLGQVVGQLEQAHRILEKYAPLTRSGRAVLDRLAERLKQCHLPLWYQHALGDVETLDLDAIDAGETGTMVSEQLFNHRRRWQEEYPYALA